MGDIESNPVLPDNLVQSLVLSVKASNLPVRSERSLTHAAEASSDLYNHSTRISSKYHPKTPLNSPTVTIFLLLNSMLGSGMLNQPEVFHNSGLVGGIIGYVIACIASWYGLVVLTEAGMHTNILEYSGLAKAALGKFGETLVDISIVVLGFGGQLGYLIIVGFTTAELLRSWGCPGEVCSNIPVTAVMSALFITPMCLYRHFGHMGILSLFSIVATVGVAFLVWAFGPYEHVQNHTPIGFEIIDTTGLLSSAGSILFAISCTTANFQAFVSTEKEFQNIHYWDIITGISVAGGCFICASMGIVGYISFGNQTEGNILDNFPQHGYDVFKVLMVVHLILYIPINFIIMRYSLVNMCSGMKSEDLSSLYHVLVSVGLVTLSTGIVLLLMGFGYTSGMALTLILNLAGGIGGKEIIINLSNSQINFFSIFLQVLCRL
jgi:sodium-coupled neutral amino acid transporter 11